MKIIKKDNYIAISDSSDNIESILKEIEKFNFNKCKLKLRILGNELYTIDKHIVDKNSVIQELLFLFNFKCLHILLELYFD